MHQVFLGIGTNLGDRRENLTKTIFYLKRLLGEVRSFSSIYETKSWGVANQPNYLNMVVAIQTYQTPQNTLATILAIEQLMGRQRAIKWGSRLIDIDLLFYDDLRVETHNLKIPHPYIPERNFVLVPLNEIAPDFVHPTLMVSVTAMLQSCKDQLACKRTELVISH